VTARTVVALGEGLLRLTPPGAAPLAGARTLELHVGGAEANVAAGVAALGVPARWASRVSAGPTGDLVLHALRAAGVDVEHVLRGPERTGLYFLEDGLGVRPTRVAYDRAGSAFAALRPEHLPDAVLDALFADAAWLHVTGIDLAIEGAPLAALARAWAHAGEAGVARSFDVNRRATLPGAAALATRARPYLATADLVFVAERDARTLWSGPDAPLATLLDDLAARAPGARLVVTRGGDGAIARAPGGPPLARAALPAVGPGRIGRGDAFAAGVLASLVDAPGDLARALAWGVAAASVKATLPGDLALLDADLVRRLADGAAPDALAR
jgi:2-dehydro-3-deoxygluconokinase